MAPRVNGPRRVRTSRRIIPTKPHGLEREPVDRVVVWKGRRRAFGTSTAMWLFLAVLVAVGALVTSLVALAVAACVLSAAVVIKAQVIILRTRRRKPQGRL